MQHPVSALPPASADTACRERTATQSYEGAVAFGCEGILHPDRPRLAINSPHHSQISTGVHEQWTEWSEGERDVIDRPTFRDASQVHSQIAWEVTERAAASIRTRRQEPIVPTAGNPPLYRRLLR